MKKQLLNITVFFFVSFPLTTGCLLKQKDPFKDNLSQTATISNQQSSQDNQIISKENEEEDTPEATEDLIEELSGDQNKDPKELRISQEDVLQVEKQEDQELNDSLNLADLEQKEEVQKWVEYFAEKEKNRFSRFITRGMHYRKMIKNLLRKQKVPTYMYYLAMIESGFVNQAKSHANAVGIWQFMAPTARRYGLKVNAYVDEREDVIRATLAAGEYLKDLYNVFQSWPLAMAAYNAGEMRIVSSIMSQKSRDFWHLARIKKLPKETSHYIPKFIAAALIGNHPEKYDITVEKGSVMESVKAVSFPAPLSLDVISQTIQVPTSVLKKLNPHLKRNHTPPGTHYRLWIPEETEINEQKIAALKPHRLNIKDPEDISLLAQTSIIYKVKSGDTLVAIGKKYGMRPEQIKQLNHLRSNKLAIGQKLKVASGKTKNISSMQLASADESASYKVRRGDSLQKIAKKFGRSVQSIKKKNNLAASRIFVGQVLSI